jgi:glycosyltransferase involved in cell wall biosynthesis
MLHEDCSLSSVAACAGPSRTEWVCFQIGAREHYAIPRALHRHGLLQQLVTDSWVPPGSALAWFVPSRSLQGRFHPDLRSAAVQSPWLGSLPFELRSRLGGSPAGWPRTIARNLWFQRWACRHLRRMRQPALNLFSYSYAARSLFQLARQQGYLCILGQMDPGPEEEQLVIAEHRRYPGLAGSWQPAPPRYWQHWAEELKLADRIVVNSSWSRDCLLRQGVSASKLRLLPLAYESDQQSPQQSAPPPLSASIPFQLLFLGTIGLRKGIARLLDAMRILEGQPVQLTLAGPSELDPQAWAGAPNIRWLGPVPRSQVVPLYQQAHAMILPTLSDGFALTQLEALAHGCPVIASTFCGEVVSPGINGWLLPSLEPEAIATTILEAIDTAHLLPRPLQRPAFGLAQLAGALRELTPPTISR